KTPPPKTGLREWQKNNNKQKPPNTLLSSQTTHPLGRATSPRQKPRTRRADDQEPTEVGLPSGSRRALRARPVSQRRVNKLREGKLGVKWADRACLSAPHLPCAPGCVGSDNMFNAAVPEIVPDRTRNRPKPLAPTTHPTRSTPAIFRLPRRRTSQRPCKKSAGCGTHSSLSIRTLLTYAPPSPIVRRAAPLLPDNPLASSRSVMVSGPPGLSSATAAARSAAASVGSSSRDNSPRPNSAWLACSTAAVAASPCTSVVSSRASRRCAARSCGRSSVACANTASSSRDKKVNHRRYRTTSASA